MNLFINQYCFWNVYINFRNSNDDRNEKKLKKGIKVYGIVDDWYSFYNGRKVNEKASDLLKYFGAKINFDKLYLNNKPVLFHPKFAVIDTKFVVFGSMNWTKSGCYNNREYTIIMKNKLRECQLFCVNLFIHIL